MNDFKLVPLFALASALAVAGITAVPPTVDGIANYKTVHSGLAVAGVPSAEALASLKARGFKTVIDLRGVAEPGVAEEAAAVRAQGLRYVHVPVSPSAFSLGDVEAVAAVLDDAQAAPVLLHCSSSNRVGAVWAVIQVRKGMSLEAAEAEGRKFGLKSDAMVEAMKRVGAEAGRDAVTTLVSARDSRRHTIVFEVTAAAPEQWESVLNSVENVQRAFGAGKSEIVVVAHGKGLGLLLGANVAMRERMQGIARAGVTFVACENTMKRMNVTKDQLASFAITVDSGVAEIVRKQEAGWSYIKSGS